MKLIAAALIISGLGGMAFMNKPRKTIAADSFNRPVSGAYAPVAVLELFTSEGCSSCPPADKLLPELAKADVRVIPLSFHVDYWNYLGWKDPFSSNEFSERQRDYVQQFKLESAYTPQLVINGAYETVGSSRNKADAAIKKALKENAAAELLISELIKSRGRLKCKVIAEGDFKKTNLAAALVQKNAVINVRAGENSGARLSHTNVVRSFVSLPAEQTQVIEMPFPADLADNNWQLVIYVQQKSNLKITGAAVYQPE
ncbi:MAG: DUF1223 domain-containing protein [Bacteroidota bacterium]